STLLGLVVERGELLRFEVELGQDLREGREVDAAGFLGVLHQRAKLVMAHRVAIAPLSGSITRQLGGGVLTGPGRSPAALPPVIAAGALSRWWRGRARSGG